MSAIGVMPGSWRGQILRWRETLWTVPLTASRGFVKTVTGWTDRIWIWAGQLVLAL